MNTRSVQPGDLVEKADNWWPTNDWGIGFVIGVSHENDVNSVYVWWSGTHVVFYEHHLDDVWLVR